MDFHFIQAKAEILLQDFQSAQEKKTRVSIVNGRVVRWIPPISLHYKLNFDEAVFNEQGAAGLGIAIQDCFGYMIGALSERIPIPVSVATVEVLACERAMAFAREVSVFDIEVEGDVEVILKALLVSDVSPPEYGHVLSNILVLANEFCFCCFSHIKALFGFC